MQSTNSATHFPLIGEPLSVDLVNTRVCRDGAVVDLLATPAELDIWLRAEAERLSWVGTATTADWRAVCRLRESIAELFRARREHSRPPATAVAQVNRALSDRGAGMRLVWTGRAPHLAPLHTRARRGALLGTLAADAVAILTSPQSEHLRQCAHPECILQFVARNARRRWCSDALCGNRARVARHYRLHRGAK